MLWEHLREEEFYDAIEESRGLCVMPMGCLEMHGQHLPVATDTMKISHALHEAAKIEPVMEFPAFKFGDVQGLVRWKGSIRLTVELEQELLKQLCSEIARNGFKKILLLNSHGGNVPMINNFIRSTQHDKKDYVVTSCSLGAKYASPYYMMEVLEKEGREALYELNDEDIDVIKEFVENKRTYGHAGFGETALIFGCNPELVRMDRADVVSGLSTHKADYLNDVGLGESTRFWGINYPNSYCGDTPYGCNERIGKCGMRLLTQAVLKVIRVLKYDDNILRWNEEWNNAW
jgi:creatinine amidohydrolase